MNAAALLAPNCCESGSMCLLLLGRGGNTEQHLVMVLEVNCLRACVPTAAKQQALNA